MINQELVRVITMYLLTISTKIVSYWDINNDSFYTTGQGSLRCYLGDSGGPWFALTTGYGIMHACFWKGQDSTSPVDISIYTSLDYLNSIGASIVTQ